MGNSWSVHQWLREYVHVHYRRVCMVGLISVFMCCPCCWVVYIAYRHFRRPQIKKTSEDRSETSNGGDDDSEDVDVDHASSWHPDADKLPNYMFFTNRRKCEPDGDYIDVIHRDWNKDYNRLETHHGFIQWLFPMWQHGVNADAHELLDDEIELIRQDDAAMERLLRSYEMMLGFYGIQLVDRQTGQVQRADNWRERFHNLNRRTHNNLRISRILRCLGIFGFRHLQSPLIEFFLNEIVAEKTLYNCRHSCFKFWMTTLDDVARRHVDDYARQLESRRWTSSPTSPGDDVQSAGQRLNGRTAVREQSTPTTPSSRVDDTGRAEADLSSRATDEDIGGDHCWDTSSTATGEERQQLTARSTSFQDDDEPHDTQLEAVLEVKGADVTIVQGVTETETGNQEQSTSTSSVQQKADWNLQTERQDHEQVEERAKGQAEEHLSHCSERTNIRDELQGDEKQRVALDVDNGNGSERDDHEEESSEELTQEQ